MSIFHFASSLLERSKFSDLQLLVWRIGPTVIFFSIKAYGPLQTTTREHSGVSLIISQRLREDRFAPR